MKNLALLTTLLTLCFLAPKCQHSGTSPVPPEQAVQARRTIVNYLECEECRSGEAEAVVKLGQLAVPTLAATLLEGPPRLSRPGPTRKRVILRWAPEGLLIADLVAPQVEV